MSDNNPDRKFALPSAAYYFKASRTAQASGQLATAVLLMENAFNHTENALYALGRELDAEIPSALVDRLGRLAISTRADDNHEISNALSIAAREITRLLSVVIQQEGLLRQAGHTEGAAPRAAAKS